VGVVPAGAGSEWPAVSALLPCRRGQGVILQSTNLFKEPTTTKPLILLEGVKEVGSLVIGNCQPLTNHFQIPDITSIKTAHRAWPRWPTLAVDPKFHP